MSRLFKLKHWLSVSETARHLTNFLMEPVSNEDVIVFLIEGRFTGSLIANPVFVCPFVEVNDTEAALHNGTKWKLSDGSFLIPSIESISLSTPHPLDLPICRATHDFLTAAKNHANYEEKLTPIPPGTLIKKHDTDEYFSILGGRNIPASLGQIVVRTSSLTDFIQSVNEEPTNAEKPLGTSERNTLLIIIAALAREAKIKIDSPGKAAAYIEGLAAELGSRASKRAIEDHLKKIPNALETRMK